MARAAGNYFQDMFRKPLFSAPPEWAGITPQPVTPASPATPAAPPATTTSAGCTMPAPVTVPISSLSTTVTRSTETAPPPLTTTQLFPSHSVIATNSASHPPTENSTTLEELQTKRRELKINAELRSLRQRQKRLHDKNGKQEECLECGEKFSDSNVLRKHYAEAHQLTGI